jgi:tripartite-type tricarboxylate transporter receptor subunit TctC
MADRLLRLVSALTLTLVSAVGYAQTAANYPCGTVKFVVPYPPGGASDLLARMLVPGLNKGLGTTLVVENKAGASGNIGTGQVSAAAGDGCTLLLGNSTGVVINRNLYKLPQDPVASLTPVAEVAAVPMVLYINASVPADNFQQLIDVIRKNPGKYSYASPGSGSTHHLLGELLKNEFGLDMTHVPYKGSWPAITDMLAGHVQIAFEGTSAIVPHLASGKIKAIATTGASRSASIPNVPTMKELGYANFVVTNWYGVFVPATTPVALVNQLNAEIRRILKSPDVVEKLVQMDSARSDYGTVEYRQFVQREVPYWESLVKKTGAKVD